MCELAPFHTYATFGYFSSIRQTMHCTNKIVIDIYIINIMGKSVVSG